MPRRAPLQSEPPGGLVPPRNTWPDDRPTLGGRSPRRSAVIVSLVDGIDPQVAGLSEGLGPAPLADGDVHGAGRRGHRPAAALIAGRVAQVVEVSVGDGGEALEAAVAEQVRKARTQSLRVAGPERVPWRASTSASSPMSALV